MRTADVIALAVVVLGLGTGGFIVYRKLARPTVIQAPATQPIGTPVAYQQPGAKSATSTQVDNTLRDVGTAVQVGAGILSTVGGLFSQFNSSSDSGGDFTGDDSSDW